MVASKRSGQRRSIRSQPDPQTVTRERNRRAIRILERDPAGVVEAAFRGDVARRLGELGAPAALVGTLREAEMVPVEWRALPVWTREPDGVQAVIPRRLVGNLVLTVMVRAGRTQWTGEERSKGGGPDVTAGQIVGEVEEAGDPLSTVIGEWLKSTPAGVVSALTAVVEAAGLADLEACPNVLIGASLSGEIAPDDEAELLGLGTAPEDEDPASLFALAPAADRRVLVPSYLLQTYDMTGGPLVSRGRGGPAPVRQRLWLYGLTVLATGDRTGDMRRFRVPAGSVIDAIWPYGWDYQRSSWPALFNAFEAINRQRLAYRDRLGVEHALHAVLFADYPQRAPSPAALRSAIIRGAVTLPEGAGKGPVLSRDVLQHAGTISGPAQRLTVAWAFYRGRHYSWRNRQGLQRWTAPTLPRARVDAVGRFLDAQGAIILDKHGRPIRRFMNQRVVFLDAAGQPAPRKLAARVRNPAIDRVPALTLNEWRQATITHPAADKRRAGEERQRLRVAADALDAAGVFRVEWLSSGQLRLEPPGAVGRSPSRRELEEDHRRRREAAREQRARVGQRPEASGLFEAETKQDRRGDEEG